MTSSFDPGLDITPRSDPLGFNYGPQCFGPEPEIRTIDQIRPSLRDPDCEGPDEVYAIVMDVGLDADRADLRARHLAFGIVTYSAGRLGEEPVRSQGHVHVRSPRNGWSTPEVYEIWDGAACVLMQEHDEDDPGRCFAVHGQPGDVIVVPPGWAHATVNADTKRNMTFAAWCDRAYGYIYDGIRSHRGMAWFPIVDDAGEVTFEANPRYRHSHLTEKVSRAYDDLGIDSSTPIYSQYRHDRARFGFVADPGLLADRWRDYCP